MFFSTSKIVTVSLNWADNMALSPSSNRSHSLIFQNVRGGVALMDKRVDSSKTDCRHRYHDNMVWKIFGIQKGTFSFIILKNKLNPCSRGYQRCVAYLLCYLYFQRLQPFLGQQGFTRLTSVSEFFHNALRVNLFLATV